MVARIALEYAALYVGAGIVIVLFLVDRYFHKAKLKIMTESDGHYKKTDPKTGIVQQGVNRPAWDYARYTGLSKMLHQSTGPVIFALHVFLLLLVLYLCTRDLLLGNLLGVNLGVA